MIELRFKKTEEIIGLKVTKKKDGLKMKKNLRI